MLGFFTSVSGTRYAIFRAASSSSYIAHAYAASADTDWHHFVASINRAQKLLTIYYDGIAHEQQIGFYGATVADLNDMGSINSTGTLTFGSDGTYPFKGILDDIRIYNGAITEKQVVELRGGTDPGQMLITLEVGSGTLTLTSLESATAQVDTITGIVVGDVSDTIDITINSGTPINGE